jgi:hypothetical protein
LPNRHLLFLLVAGSGRKRPTPFRNANKPGLKIETQMQLVQQ